MARLNNQQQQLNILKTQPMQLDVGIVDGMQAAVSDTLRALPTASAIRGIENLFDQTAPMSAEEANEKFDLEGEAAFTDEDDVTMGKAQARSTDGILIERNALIQNIVNEESPVLGRATQFAASMAAGFTDPALLALNVGASMALAKGIGSIAASRGVMNAVIKANPTAGRMLLTAYAEGGSQTLMTHLAREGAENILGSVAEETINFAGIGEDQLARKVTFTESLMNITMGTVLGTGLGTVMSSSGRKAVASSWARKYGDSAAELVHAKNLHSQLELEMGVKVNSLADMMYDYQTFETKPWHEAEFSYVDSRESIEGSPQYLSLDADGVIHTYSHRGEGTVLTSNPSHAHNTGASVRNIDATNTKILKPSDINGNGKTTKRIKSKLVNGIVDNFIANADDASISKAAAMLIDPSVQSSRVATVRARTALKKQLKEQLLNLVDIEDMIDVMDEIHIRSDSENVTHSSIDGVLEANGYDGYTFQGRNSKGEVAYDGTYVTSKSAKKLKTESEVKTRVLDEVDKMKSKIREEAILKEYAGSLDKSYKVMQAARDLDATGDKDAPEHVAPEQNAGARLMSTKNKTEYMQNKLDEIQAKIDNNEILVTADENTYRVLKHAFEDADPDTTAIREAGLVTKFVDCLKASVIPF